MGQCRLVGCKLMRYCRLSDISYHMHGHKPVMAEVAGGHRMLLALPFHPTHEKNIRHARFAARRDGSDPFRSFCAGGRQHF